MINVQDAKELVTEQSFRLGCEDLPLAQCLGRILHGHILSPLDLPPFDQSAMDGYAVNASTYQPEASYHIIGESTAGAPFTGKIGDQECVRIFTGAQIPAYTNAVIVKESAVENENTVRFSDQKATEGQNIRYTGSQIHKGEEAIEAGTLLTAASIGFLASMGYTSVSVFRQPSVAILSTGNELVEAGKLLGPGQMYESNSITLQSALMETGIRTSEVFFSPDDPEQLTDLLKDIMSRFDLILLSGGISVGKYDFTLTALQNCGVKQHFHKVTQKPGKPLYFGTTEKNVFFGLPGNPAATLTCYYIYVFPAVQKMSGHRNHRGLMRSSLPLKGTYQKKAGLTHFLKGVMEDGHVRALPGQESYILKSFSEANCILEIPAESTEVTEGTMLDVLHLPVVS